MRYTAINFLLLSSLILISCDQKDQESPDIEQSASERLYLIEEETDMREQKINAIPDEALMDDLHKINNISTSFKRILLSLEEKPKQKSIIVSPASIVDDYENVDELIKQYHQGIFADRISSSETEYEYIINKPFDFPFIIEKNYKEFNFSDGSVKKIQPDNNQYKDDMELEEIITIETKKSYRHRLRVLYPKPDNKKKPQPLSIRSDFKFLAPKVIYKFEFSRQDVGKTKTIDDYCVELVDIDDNHATITMTNFPKQSKRLDGKEYEDLKIVAYDKNGEELSSHQVIHGPDNFDDAIVRLDKILDEALTLTDFSENSLASIKSKTEPLFGPQSRFYYQTSFRGRLKNIAVIIYDYSEINEITASFDIPTMNIRTEHHDDPIDIYKFDSLIYDKKTTGLLANRITINESDLDESIYPRYFLYKRDSGKIQAKIYFQPRYDTLTQQFIDSLDLPIKSVKSIRFYDKKHGQEISVDYKIQPYEGSGRNIIFYQKNIQSTPLYIEGVVEIEIPSIENSSYSIDSLPDGIEHLGNQVIINETKYPPNKHRFFLQRNGKILKEVNRINYHNRNSDNKLVIIGYTSPDVILHYQVSSERTIDYEFSIDEVE